MLPIANEIHVWQVDLDTSPAEFNYLSFDEQERATRFKRDLHRSRFANGRNALRIIIGQYLQIHPAELEFAFGSMGKPYLPQPAGLFFNVSHSKSIMLAAFSTTSEVGIDVEINRCIDDEAQIVTRFFESAEQADYFNLPANLRSDAFFNAWTRKEAFVKAQGNGLQTPLDSFSVSIDPRESCRLKSCLSFHGKSSDWNLQDISVSSAYTGALAAKHGEVFINSFEFTHSIPAALIDS